LGCYAAGFRLAYAIPGISDLYSYFLPKYAHAASRLAAGELPLWNPYELLGLPFLATIQPATLYPPVRLVYLFASGETAHHVLLVSHLLLGAFFSVGFARSVGLSPWVAVLAAGWVVQPMWLLRVHAHPIYTAGLVWLPALLLLSRQVVHAPSSRGMGYLTLVAALAVLAGYPPIAFALAYATALAVIFWIYESRAHRNLRACRRSAVVLLAAGTLAGLLAAAQILPGLRYVLATDRPALVETTTSAIARSESPVLRYLLGIPEITLGSAAHNVWLEFGPLLLLCAAAGLASRRSRVPAAYLALLFAIATFAPLRLLQHLPFYGLVRFGQEWTFLAPIPLFLLAAIGVDWLVSFQRQLGMLAMPVVLVVLSGSTAWNMARPERTRVVAPPPARKELPASVREACGLEPGRFRLYWPEAQVLGTLLEARVASPGGVEQSLPIGRSTELLRLLGITTYLPGTWAAGFSAHPDLGERLGVRCLITARRLPGLEAATGYRPVPAAGLPGVLYRTDRALPRVRMAFDALWVSSPEEQLRLLGEALVPVDTVLLEGSEPSRSTACATGPRMDSTEILEFREERVRVRTSAPCRGYLVVTDAWEAGWRATVDGKPTPILRADYALRAVSVDGGTHEVVLEYDPAEVRVGLVLSGVGLVVLTGCLIRAPRRRPSSTNVGDDEPGRSGARRLP
jgi:hypothetical protein